MKKAFIFTVLIFAACSVFAADFIDGRIKLVINPNNGRFSLYYMTDIAREEFAPLFASQDPRTSFLSVIVNNRTYKLGESSSFKTSIGGTPSNPSLIFESSFIVVTQNFSFIKTGTSSITNGVLITVTIANKSVQAVEAGFRLLIDTELGEKNGSHFYSNSREINQETVISGASEEQYWVSKNDKLVLMGSITGQNQQDVVHFANWKRLNDAPWKIPFMQGRNFNLLPYSIDDSAVCYYYEPSSIPKDGSRIASIALLSFAPADDESIFAFDTTDSDPRIAAGSAMSKTGEELADDIRSDLAALHDLVFRLDESIVSNVYISDEELAAISLLISRIKLKYSIP